jgi:hypothetical protein
VHLRAVATVQGADAALARLYVPASAPVTLERGHLDATVSVRHDARDGTQVDVDARATDLALIDTIRRAPVLAAPSLTIQVKDLAVAPGGTTVGEVVVAAATGMVMDTRVTPSPRFDVGGVRLRAEALSWPVTAPAKVELSMTVPGNGQLSARGTVRMNPNAADLRVRLSGLDLGPWARYLPERARVGGVASADLAVTAALGSSVTARARGDAAIDGLTVTDAGRRVAGAARAEALGIDVDWPSRVQVARVKVRRPLAALERSEDGRIGVQGMSPPTATSPDSSDEPDFAPPVGERWKGQVAIGEVSVEDGALAWSDATVTPAARLQIVGVHATARDVVWPTVRPVRIEARAGTPGGGQLSASGLVGLDPVTAELRLTARGADVGAYRSYIPLAASVSGRADFDLAVGVAGRGKPTTVQGRAALTRVAVIDGERRLLSAERLDVAGVDVAWPGRVTASRIALSRPWVLVERDEKGGLPIRALLTPRRDSRPGGGDAAAPAHEDAAGEPTAITIGTIVVADGGARFVDYTLKPAYTEDLSRLAVRIDGVTTQDPTPARVELSGRLGPGATLGLRGAVRPIGGPFFADVKGEVKDFAIPRVNAYLAHALAWTAREGRFSTAIAYRVEGDRLTARNDIHLARLRVVRAGMDDEAKKRVGLPLGLIVALMKNARGDIDISLPVGGRLGDPQFDVREVIWTAVRAIAVKTIATPVSWIGRLQFTADSRIEDIAIDPAPFAAGTATLTPAGEEQVGRLNAFMRASPDAKLVLTPVVTVGDLDALKRAAIEEAIARASHEARIPPPVAAARLFAERFPGRPAPATPEEIVAVVSRDGEPPEAEARRLAGARLDAVRSALKKAGVDGARLDASTEPEAAEIADGGRVEFGLTDQVRPRRHLLAELLRKLRELFARRPGPADDASPAASPATERPAPPVPTARDGVAARAR